MSSSTILLAIALARGDDCNFGPTHHSHLTLPRAASRDACKKQDATFFLSHGAMPLASFVRTELGRSAVVMGGYSQVLFGLKGERWAEEDAKKMNTLFSNPAWMFPLMDDTPERLRGGGAGSQYWARRPGDAHQSCPV